MLSTVDVSDKILALDIMLPLETNCYFWLLSLWFSYCNIQYCSNTDIYCCIALVSSSNTFMNLRRSVLPVLLLVVLQIEHLFLGCTNMYVCWSVWKCLLIFTTVPGVCLYSIVIIVSGYTSESDPHSYLTEAVTNKAPKKSMSLQRDSNLWRPWYRCSVQLPTELWSLIGSRSSASSIHTRYR